MVRFIVAPIWQGSPSPRAMRLMEGAEAIAGDLPRAATSWIDIPSEAGDTLDTGVHRASTVARVLGAIGEQLAATTERTITIGGDCSVAVAGAAHHAADDLAIVWFDAHPDLHTPDSSPSGAFSGMALRAVLGEAPAALGPATGIPGERIVLVGARALDAGEEEAASLFGIRRLGAEGLNDPEALAALVAGTGAARVYVHIDVDVFDPLSFAGVSSPQPFGADPSAVVASLRALRGEHELVGASISGFVPTSPDEAAGDVATILRLIGALA